MSRRSVWPKSLTAVVILGLTAGLSGAGAADVPTPESRIGFRPGADGRLVGWDAVVEYFRRVDAASDRVGVLELGPSTEGRPMIAALISSPGNLKDLGRIKALQRDLADPRRFAKPGDAADAVARSKAVVMITCSIHSTETASTLMALELLHDLATGEDPDTLATLDQTVVILVPSANPDGVDIVADWYGRSKGHPWEGSGLPKLYHKYAGHDTNRDWFMLNLAETRALSRLLYREWFPTILYDVHQMGRAGARLFVPPFHDPINPNLDPRMHQSIFTIGAHMASDLAAAGKRGVLTGGLYDNWWNGGNRTTPQRHNIVGVLTEAASVRMATPIFLEKEELKGGGRGFPDHKPSVHFVDPWPGGAWRLRDIVDYELICARSVLTLATRYRDRFQANLLAMAGDAVKTGASEPPYGWVVPADQRDPGSAARLVRALHDTGVEVRAASEPFKNAGVEYAAGSWYIPAAQPYRAHVKDMMERQVYPNRLTAAGRAEPPYDVAGWTLPLQMGVRAVALTEKPAVKGEPLDRIEAPKGTLVEAVKADWLSLGNQTNDDFRVLNALWDGGVKVSIGARDVSRVEPLHLVVPAEARSREVLKKALPGASSKVVSRSASNPKPFARPRLAVYQPWVPSMDEGWTRLVLENFGFAYTTVHDAEVRSGRLKDRFDVILIASISPKTLESGYGPDETEPEFVGGLGSEGLAELRTFVSEGGRLVTLGAACDYAIESLDLPLKNVLKGRPSSEFYAPGSVLRTTTAVVSDVATGVPSDVSVYVDDPAAFEATDKSRVAMVSTYAATRPLESGWLLGPERIQGKGALAVVTAGKGTVVLFGFRPQHRGQTHGTFRLLFNAILGL